MGHPKKTRKKYKTPSHPWQKDRLEEEKILTKEYGLKNKKELWKGDSHLRKVKRQAKTIDITKLQEKATKLVAKHKKYNVDYMGYSLDDM